MDWQQTTLLPDMRTVFWGLVRTAPEKRDEHAIAAAVTSLKELWARLDAHLQGRRFVAGDSLTMGDIPVGLIAYRFRRLSPDWTGLDNLDRWYQGLEQRAAFKEQILPVPFV